MFGDISQQSRELGDKNWELKSTAAHWTLTEYYRKQSHRISGEYSPKYIYVPNYSEMRINALVVCHCNLIAQRLVNIIKIG